MTTSLPPPPAHFTAKKAKILAQLAVPDAEYTDASPKGSVDARIRELIDEINGGEGLVTTSSCAGRVSVFLEGRRTTAPAPAADAAAAADGDEQAPAEEPALGGDRTRAAGVGGKGGGGRWLFVSHDPVHETRGDGDWAVVLGVRGEGVGEGEGEGKGMEIVDGVGETRMIHFKFEPMILHILAASPEHAQLVLRCGLQAGFRESGALNLLGTGRESATPMVAIRSMGLGLESLIGMEKDGRRSCTVTQSFLGTLVRIANERFDENAKRIERFRSALQLAIDTGNTPMTTKDGVGWEDAATRRERKRAEGLKRRADLMEERSGAGENTQ